MCGILVSFNCSNPLDVVVNNLAKLEYRGADSFGVAAYATDYYYLYKDLGKPSSGIKKLKDDAPSGPFMVCLGHTRWASDGEVSKENTHPHKFGKFCIVHNGNVTIKKDHEDCRTDTEIFIEFLENVDSFEVPLRDNINIYLSNDNACVIYNEIENKLYAIAKGNKPLYLGDNSIICSDLTVINELCDTYISLADSIIEFDLNRPNCPAKMYDLNGLELDLVDLRNNCIPPEQLDSIIDNMESEILEQEKLFIEFQNKKSWPEELRELLPIRDGIIHFVGCGSSYYAALFTELYFQHNFWFKTKVHYASNFQYYQNFSDDDLFILVSQSGETYDTLKSLDKLKNLNRQQSVISITNNSQSFLAKKTIHTKCINVGPEIGVAATKTFSGTIMELLSVFSGYEEFFSYTKNLLPFDQYFQYDMGFLAENLNRRFTSYLFLGNDYYYALAGEGALKFKELLYVHADHMPAAEIKHGPLAYIDDKICTIALLDSEDENLENTLSNLRTVKVRGGYILGIVNGETSPEMKSVLDEIVEIPRYFDFKPLQALLSIVPIQWLAYFIAKEMGHDPNHPKALAKAITV